MPVTNKIIRFPDAPTKVPRAKRRKDKGAPPPRVQPPFKVAFTIANGDESDPPPSDTLAVLTRALEDDAWKYYLWDIDKKGDTPFFAHVVDKLCTQRVSLTMGLGSNIYFESKEDALRMLDYYADKVDETKDA